jgi:hypothetical protein
MAGGSFWTKGKGKNHQILMVADIAEDSIFAVVSDDKSLPCRNEDVPIYIPPLKGNIINWALC